MESARDAFAIIEKATRNNPTTSQARRPIRFLVGLYNGNDYPFDRTDLSGTALRNAYLDYLSCDHLGKLEVHRHLAGGEDELHEWMRIIGLLNDPDPN